VGGRRAAAGALARNLLAVSESARVAVDDVVASGALGRPHDDVVGVTLCGRDGLGLVLHGSPPGKILSEI
jgi:hypothetical protein